MTHGLSADQEQKQCRKAFMKFKPNLSHLSHAWALLGAASFAVTTVQTASAGELLSTIRTGLI
jgi:hypothetical protein